MFLLDHATRSDWMDRHVQKLWGRVLSGDHSHKVADPLFELSDLTDFMSFFHPGTTTKPAQPLFQPYFAA